MKSPFVLMGLLGLFPWLSSSCFQPLEEVENVLESESSGKGKTTLRLTTRSSTGVIDYPVMVLAYDADGNLSQKQVLSSADDEIKMNLTVGDYRISAITGFSAYIEPKSYETSDAVIKMPTVGYALSPLFVGSADVELIDKSAMVEVVMSSRSASMEITLKGLPTSVESTSVSVARQYGAIGMDSKYSLAVISKVACTKEDNGNWSTGKIYVFPGAETQTVLTITISDAGKQYSYGYTVNEPLEAAVPYILNGTYKEGERLASFDISGSLSVDAWKDSHIMDFEFGEGASSSTTGNEPVVDNEEATTLPAELSVWKGHVVAKVLYPTETSEDLLLVSLQEYTNVSSANVEGHETDAMTLANSYVEDELSGWSIPSPFEIQQLKERYKDENMADLNAVIESLGGTGLTVKDSNNKSVRYLCDDALQAVGFSSRSPLDKAGTSVKYSLRLVKRVHISLTQ